MKHCCIGAQGTKTLFFQITVVSFFTMAKEFNTDTHFFPLFLGSLVFNLFATTWLGRTLNILLRLRKSHRLLKSYRNKNLFWLKVSTTITFNKISEEQGPFTHHWDCRYSGVTGVQVNPIVVFWWNEWHFWLKSACCIWSGFVSVKWQEVHKIRLPVWSAKLTAWHSTHCIPVWFLVFTVQLNF